MYINLKANPNYEGVKVLDGNSYKLRVHWNTNTEKWYMNIIGISNDVEINGMALLCGKDLLTPYGYTELGQLWMVDNKNADEDPNYDDIGTRFTCEYTPVS